jgi:hypothetical protein
MTPLPGSRDLMCASAHMLTQTVLAEEAAGRSLRCTARDYCKIRKGLAAGHIPCANKRLKGKPAMMRI